MEGDGGNPCGPGPRRRTEATDREDRQPRSRPVRRLTPCPRAGPLPHRVDDPSNRSPPPWRAPAPVEGRAGFTLDRRPNARPVAARGDRGGPYLVRDRRRAPDRRADAGDGRSPCHDRLTTTLSPALGHEPTPQEADPTGSQYAFEKRVKRLDQYTRSSVMTFARRNPSARRASLNRLMCSASAGVRAGMNGVARTFSSAPDATTWRAPALSRRATVQPSSDPTFSRTRPASFSEQQPPAYGLADHDRSGLIVRMFGVAPRSGQPIEDGRFAGTYVDAPRPSRALPSPTLEPESTSRSTSGVRATRRAPPAPRGSRQRPCDTHVRRRPLSR